jgi:hypothetical protein
MRDAVSGLAARVVEATEGRDACRRHGARRKGTSRRPARSIRTRSTRTVDTRIGIPTRRITTPAARPPQHRRTVGRRPWSGPQAD